VWKTLVRMNLPANVALYVPELQIVSLTSTAGHMRFRWVVVTSDGTAGGTTETLAPVTIPDGWDAFAGITLQAGKQAAADWDTPCTLDAPPKVLWKGYANTGYGGAIWNGYWTDIGGVPFRASSKVALQVYSPSVAADLLGHFYISPT
jgi:hypothetical protein